MVEDILSTGIITIIGGVIGGIISLIGVYYTNKFQIEILYREPQLNLYMDFYSALYDLKIAADNLWNDPNSFKLESFAKELEKTENTINRNSLLLENSQEEILNGLISDFWNFREGKKNLLKAYKTMGLSIDELFSNEGIKKIIESNKEIKNRYERTLENIKISFRKRIGV